MLGYILGLLKGFKHLRKTGDLIGDNLTLNLLRRTYALKIIFSLSNKQETLLLKLSMMVKKFCLSIILFVINNVYFTHNKIVYVGRLFS